MKIRKIFLMSCAIAYVLSFCGCSDGQSEESANVSSSTSSLSAEHEVIMPKVTGVVGTLKKPELPTNIKTAKTKINEKRIPKKGTSDKMRISSSNTGIEITAPSGMNIYNGEKKEQMLILPETIPTIAEPIVISNELGCNLNFFASVGIDYNEFNSLKQEDVEEVFLAGAEWSSSFDSIEVTNYERGTYDGYNGIRMDIHSVMNDTEMLQTIIMVNVVEENTADGYSFTITYTDTTYGMQEEFAESIETIGFSNVANMYSQYKTPEECAEGQRNGEYEKFNKSALIKSHMEERGIDSDTVDRIMDAREQAIEDAENNTRPTLSREEMRKKYLGE